MRRVLTPGARRALVIPAFELHAVWSRRLNIKRDEILRARLSEKRHAQNGLFQNYYDVDALVQDLDASSSPMRLFEMLVKRDQSSSRVDDVDARALNLTLPYSTKEKLRRLVYERRLASGFQTKYWSVAHGPTNYTAFWEDNSEGTYRVFDRAANDRHPWYFEPYVVLRADEAIDFDESFVAYGFNKIAWITELAAIGFEFHSTRNAWVVHTNAHRTRATAASRGQRLSKVSRAPGVFDRFSTRAHRTLVHSGVFTSTGVRVRILSRRERILRQRRRPERRSVSTRERRQHRLFRRVSHGFGGRNAHAKRGDDSRREVRRRRARFRRETAQARSVPTFCG